MSERSVGKGLAAGAAGGLVASLVMNQFQALWGRLMEDSERSHGAQSLQQGSPDHGVGRELKERAAMRAGRCSNAISQRNFKRGC